MPVINPIISRITPRMITELPFHYCRGQLCTGIAMRFPGRDSN
jgi:hypothetical protein